MQEKQNKSDQVSGQSFVPLRAFKMHVSRRETESRSIRAA